MDLRRRTRDYGMSGVTSLGLAALKACCATGAEGSRLAWLPRHIQGCLCWSQECPGFILFIYQLIKDRYHGVAMGMCRVGPGPGNLPLE